MNKFKIFTIALIGSATFSQAQDLDPAKKAIDSEQFEKAKSLLKSLVQSKPTNGEAPFLLGKIYLSQNLADSAKIYFQKGLAAKDFGKLNYIGLGQMDLDNGNASGAQSNFALATKDMKKKDTQEFVYIARAYMGANKPDYKSALAILAKAKAINYQDPQVELALGDAFYGDKNQSDSYSSYRNAFVADNSLIRAKMQLGVLLKGAGNFPDAVKELNNVVSSTPNYGPVFRELAETYYKWGNFDAPKYKEYTQKALNYYEQYMSLTDYSLNSRMRHADFLVLAKDFVALEAEANKMKQLDKVNPRILRYLGYAAYQNGNTDIALKSLEDYIANPATKKIARDYYFLGLSKIKKATGADGKIVDQAKFDSAVADLKTSIEMEPKIGEDLNDIGSGLFKEKSYAQAASIFELATVNKEEKNYLMDNFYLGYSIYYGYDKTKPNPAALSKADLAFSNVIEAAPTTQDAYLFKARINNLLEKDDLMAKNFQDYIDQVTLKGADEMTKNKAKFIEAYNQIGAFYANTDKVKAKEMWSKTLALDPTNTYATDSIASLSSVAPKAPAPVKATTPPKKKS
jgi:Tfp pilus assembly protein PilF